MNTFAKYCPCVWLAKSEEEHEKGSEIIVANQYGDEKTYTVFKKVIDKTKSKDGKSNFYSIISTGKSYAERKAEKYAEWSASQEEKSEAAFTASQKNRAFLSLGEPIKVGHHSEARHRKMFEQHDNAMRRCVEASDMAKEHARKSEYWKSRANEITLAMPESVDFYTNELEEAKAEHLAYKSGEKKQEHSYSMAYAKKRVNEIEKKLKIAMMVWGT